MSTWRMINILMKMRNPSTKISDSLEMALSDLGRYQAFPSWSGFSVWERIAKIKGFGAILIIFQKWTSKNMEQKLSVNQILIPDSVHIMNKSTMQYLKSPTIKLSNVELFCFLLFQNGLWSLISGPRSGRKTSCRRLLRQSDVKRY